MYNPAATMLLVVMVDEVWYFIQDRNFTGTDWYTSLKRDFTQAILIILSAL